MGTRRSRTRFKCHFCKKGKAGGLSGVPVGWIVVLDREEYAHVCSPCQDNLGIPSLEEIILKSENNGS